MNPASEAIPGPVGSVPDVVLHNKDWLLHLFHSQITQDGLIFYYILVMASENCYLCDTCHSWFKADSTEDCVSADAFSLNTEETLNAQALPGQCLQQT